MGTCRYKSQFFGQNSGIKYDFELHDLDYSGSSTEVTLDAGGVTIEYTEDNNVFAGIRSSQCTAVMKINNSAMESDIISLINKPDKKLYILIYKDGDLYWGGPINLTGIQIEQNSNPPFIKWQAMDWIGGLQNIKWDNTNWGIVTASLITYTKVLADMFVKAYPSFANTFYMPGTTLFSTVTPITSTQFSGNPDPFANTLFNTSAYTDDSYKYSFTYHQVLEMLLTDWCAKVIYSDGIYRVIDLRQYEWPTQWKEYLYDKNGNEVSNSTYDNTITYDSDNYIWAVDPLLNVNAAYKIVKRTFRAELSLRTNDQEGNLIYQNGGRNFNETFFLGQILTGWLDYIHYPIILQSEDEIQFSIRLNVKSDDLLQKLKYLVVVLNVTNGTTTQRLYNNGKFKRGVANNGVPEPFIWGSPNADRYLIFPYAGGSQSNFSFKFKSPYASTRISLCEYALIGEYINKIGSLVSGSNVIKNLDCSDLKIGMQVKGSNIPNGTYITNIYNWTNNGIPYAFIEMSANATATSAYQTILFYDSANIILNTDPSLIDSTVELSLLPSGAVTTNEGAEYKAINTNEANLILELPDARVGDNINSNGKTSLRVNNGMSYVLTTNSWKYKPALTTETANSFIQKLVNNIGELTNESIKFYDGSLYYKIFYGPHTALLFTTNSIAYTLVFNGGTYTLDSDEVSGSWWMIKRVIGSTTGNSGNTGTKIGTKDIYKDIYPYLDVPKLDNDIKISQYEVGNTTGVLSMVRGATINLSEITLGYIASDPQFAFQETGATPTATNVKEGDICFTNSNGKQWKYTNGAWVQQFQAQAAGSGGVSSIGTIDSQTKSANGLVISGTSLVAQTADASNVGMVSIGTQTFAGAKTFNANGAASTPVILLSGTIFSGGNTFTTTPQLLVEPTKSSYSSVTGNASTDVITATGHNFTVGTGVRFSLLTGGSGLSTNTLYYVGNVSGNTFQLATSLALAIAGSFINFTTNITDGTIVASSGWNTNGTLLGLSSNTGFTGDLINIQENGQPRFKIATTSSNNTITTFNGYASNSGSVRVTLDNIGNGGILSLIADSAGTNTVTTNYIMGFSSGINIVAGNNGNQTIALNGTIKIANGKTFVASNGRTFLTVNENTGNAQARIGLGLGSALTSGTESVFNLAGAATPASGSTVMYGFSIQSAMTASANNQAMTALYIQPSFSNGAFTGVTNNLINVLSSGGNNIFKANNGGQIDIGYSSATMGFYGVTAISRPTTSISGATYSSPGAGSNVKTDDTFGGYTIAKVVQALINLGLLT